MSSIFGVLLRFSVFLPIPGNRPVLVCSVSQSVCQMVGLLCICTINIIVSIIYKTI
jgi:hypothetical protein